MTDLIEREAALRDVDARLYLLTVRYARFLPLLAEDAIRREVAETLRALPAVTPQVLDHIITAVGDNAEALRMLRERDGEQA